MKKKTADKQEPYSKQISSVSSNNKSTIIYVIIVFCLPVLLYLQTLGFGFIGYDDTDIISNNLAFLSDFRNAPRVFLKDALLADASNFYRPLQTLSYMVDIQLSGGNNPWMYHLTNVLLLGFIACLLFIFLREFSIPIKLSLIGALIYCIHPLFVPFVAWIPSRGDLLLSIFSLLSFLFLAERLRKKKIVYSFLHWLTFTIALFCKETAVFLPLPFIVFYFTYSSGKRFEKKYLLDIALYAVSGIFWLWLHFLATANFLNQNDVGFGAILSNLQTIPDSLANFILPFKITLVSNYSILKTLAGLGIIILIMILFVINKERTKKEKVFCLAWFIFLLLPTMLYKNEFIDYLSHRLFLPLIGILLFVLFILPKKWVSESDSKKKIAVNVVYVCILALFSTFTFLYSRSYSDTMSFYNSSISQNPDNASLYNNRGNAKNNIKDFQGAIEDFTKAIELKPNYVFAYNNRGNAYKTIGDPDKAIKDFNKAIELSPNTAEAYYNRGNSYYKNGDFEMAIENFNKAIELNPNLVETYFNLGNVYYKKGDLETSIKNYSKAIELKPYFAEAYNNRGYAYGNMGDLDKALKDFDKTIGLDPNFAPAYFALGNVHKAKGMLKESDRDFEIYEKLMKKK
jgi:protein O-mannosyl-transferase